MPWIRLLFLVTGLIGINVYYPDSLSDKNSFLKDFLDNDILSVLGFITAVTIASAANIHLQLNSLEESGFASFGGTRSGLWLSAVTLIVMFGMSFVLVVVKPILSEECGAERVINSLALVVVYVCLEVMWDITKTAFGIPPNKPKKKGAKPT